MNKVLIALIAVSAIALAQNGADHLTRGDWYLRDGRYSDALSEYELGGKQEPGRKIVYLKHEIEALIRQGKLNEALTKDEEILQQDPNDPEARGLKATVLLDRGFIAQAVPELQAVVAARPDNFVARFNLGRGWFLQGDHGQAREQLDQVVQQRPDYLPARIGRIQLALVLGDRPSAVRDADEIANTAKPGIPDDPALSGLPMHVEALALIEQAKHR